MGSSATPRQLYSISIQFNIVYIITEVVSGHFSYRAGLDQTLNSYYLQRHNISPMSKNLVTAGKKNSLLTGRNVEQILAHPGGRPTASISWVGREREREGERLRGGGIAQYKYHIKKYDINGTNNKIISYNKKG